MSLDTLANVKTRLGVTGNADDALLTLLMNAADKWVGNHCGRDFGGGTYTEYHPGGSEFVHLKNFPVQSVTSVKVDPAYAFGADTLVPSTSYVVHTERGVIQSLAGPFVPAADRQGLVNRDVRHWTRGPHRLPEGPRVVRVRARGEVVRAGRDRLFAHHGPAHGAAGAGRSRCRRADDDRHGGRRAGRCVLRGGSGADAGGPPAPAGDGSDLLPPRR